MEKLEELGPIEVSEVERIDDLGLLVRLGTRLEYRQSGDHFLDPATRGVRLRGTLRDFLIRRLLRIRTKERGNLLMRLNRAQKEYSAKCTKRNIVLKARQLGMTTYIAARYFIQTITQPGTLTVQVAHSQESAEEIFRIVQRFRENLPKGLQYGALDTSRANVRQVVFPHVDSEYRVETADEEAGRGLTIHNLHCSEVARWSRGGLEALASLRAAAVNEGEIVLESTPNGAGGVFYEEWQRAPETGYTRHFFPWWYGKDYAFKEKDLQGVPVEPLTEEENELVKQYRLTPGQIAFRRVNRAQLRGFAAQEFAEDPVSCFRASGECVFEMEAIDKALSLCGEPAETSENGRVSLWIPPKAGREYIVGVDPAGGGCDGDFACAEVIDRETGMQCAELYGHFPPRELAQHVAALGERYNRALVAVERNNHGYGVLAHLREEKYGNVYQEGTSDGWLTSAVTRPPMIENLAAVLVTRPEIFHSRVFLSECRTFVRQADGDTRAAAGAHDDSVMAMAIAFAARRKTAGVRREVEVGSLVVG